MQVPGESGGKAEVKVDIKKEEKSVSLLLLATMPKVEKTKMSRQCTKKMENRREKT